jgi:hypothetical protein
MDDVEIVFRNDTWAVIWGDKLVSRHASWGEALYAAMGRTRPAP